MKRFLRDLSVSVLFGLRLAFLVTGAFILLSILIGVLK